jgi:Phage tail lysozyme
MDIKSFFGLNGNSFTNIKNSLLDLANVLENQIIPKIQRVEKSVSNIAKDAAKINGGVGTGNKVADSGAPTAKAAGDGGTGGTGGAGGTGGGGGNRVADNGSFAAKAVGVGMYGMNLLQNAMPGVSTAVQQDFLTNRAAFYGVAGFGGSLSGRTDQINALQRQMASQGTMLNSMDALNAIMAAQNNGLGGAKNFSSQGGVLSGIATLSNLMPGLGGAGPNGTSGAAAVAANFNAPSTVNMARAMGINIRGANGDIMGVDKIIDQLWAYFNKPGMPMLTPDQIKESWMPGRYFYESMNSLLNGDQMSMQAVYIGFLAKAQTGGNTPIQNISKSTLQGLGASTATVNAIARNVAGQTNLLTKTASATAGGFAASQDLGALANNAAASLGALAQALGAVNGAYTGTAALGGGTGGKIINTLLGLIGLRAEGGPVGNKMPYIVGEKGPELFVPKTDGMIVPNNAFGLNRASGGAVSSNGGSAMDVYNFLTKNGLSSSGATGVIGNLYQESGLNPNSVGDSGTSYGLAQWHNGRRDSLMAFAKSKNLSPNSTAAQEQYLIYDLKKNYPSLMDSLSSKGITEGNAAALFMQQYERPADQSTAAAQKRANLGIAAVRGNFDPKVTVSSGPSAASTSTSLSAITARAMAASQEALSASAQMLGIVNPSTSTTSPSSNINYNYGGITITISAAGKDAKQLAQDLKKEIATKTAGK